MIQVCKGKENNTSKSKIFILKSQSPRSLYPITEKKISRDRKVKRKRSQFILF